MFLVRGEKVLVVNGGPPDEIIDLKDSEYSCILPKFPVTLRGSTGGLIGKTPLVCGGDTYDYKNKQDNQACYTLQIGGEGGFWKKDESFSQFTGRNYAATGSVLINNGLVMVGGVTEWSKIASTIELVGRNRVSQTLNVQLPTGTLGSCIVPWNSHVFMVIGGNTHVEGLSHSNTKATYWIGLDEDFSKGILVKGPELGIARSFHACSEMTVNGEEYIVVTGGNTLTESPTTSTEMLAKNWTNWSKTGAWQKGADMPVPINHHQMIASQDKQIVYTIGNDVYSQSQKIWRYFCNGDISKCQWTKMETQLQYGRGRFVAFPIPNSLASKFCQ